MLVDLLVLQLIKDLKEVFSIIKALLCPKIQLSNSNLTEDLCLPIRTKELVLKDMEDLFQQNQESPKTV